MPKPALSIQQFIAWEEQQAGRNEYFRGETFAMVGGRRGRGRVIANLMRHLGNHLDDTPCQAFSENMKVRVGDDAVLYPDVFVTCDRQFDAAQALFTDPVLIVEVLSPSTQRYDRSEKFAIYRKLAALQEYVLIDPDTRRVEVFLPSADGTGAYLDMTETGTLTLRSVGLDLALADVFKGMRSDDPA